MVACRGLPTRLPGIQSKQRELERLRRRSVYVPTPSQAARGRQSGVGMRVSTLEIISCSAMSLRPTQHGRAMRVADYCIAAKDLLFDTVPSLE